MPDIQPLVNIAVSDHDIVHLQNACKKLESMIRGSRVDLDRNLGEQKAKEEELEVIQAKRKEIQFKFDLQEQLIRKLETQVPNIRNQKEYVASKKQLEEARKGRGQLEEILLELDIRSEELESLLKNLKEVINGLDSKFHDEADELISHREENKLKIKQLSRNHSELVVNLPNMIRRFYDKCVISHMPQPICIIEDKTCSGCHMLLQPQMVNELMVNPNTYKTCPHCSRVPIYLPPVEEETGAA